MRVSGEWRTVFAYLVHAGKRMQRARIGACYGASSGRVEAQRQRPRLVQRRQCCRPSGRRPVTVSASVGSRCAARWRRRRAGGRGGYRTALEHRAARPRQRDAGRGLGCGARRSPSCRGGPGGSARAPCYTTNERTNERTNEPVHAPVSRNNPSPVPVPGPGPAPAPVPVPVPVPAPVQRQCRVSVECSAPQLPSATARRS